MRTQQETGTAAPHIYPTTRVLNHTQPPRTGDWADWVRGNHKLRAVPPLPCLEQLHTELLTSLPPTMPWRLQARLLAAVPLPSVLPRRMPAAGGAQRGPPGAGEGPPSAATEGTVVYPWVMHELGGEGMCISVEGQRTVATAGAQWLKGGRLRPRGALAYGDDGVV